MASPVSGWKRWNGRPRGQAPESSRLHNSSLVLLELLFQVRVSPKLYTYAVELKGYFWVLILDSFSRVTILAWDVLALGAVGG